MGKPKTELTGKEYDQDINFLFQVLGGKSPEEIESFVKEILTASELRMLKKRWYIACLLKKGGNLRQIAQKARASTQTVIQVKRRIKEGQEGLRMALERIKEGKGKQADVSKEGQETASKNSDHYWVFGRVKEP